MLVDVFGGQPHPPPEVVWDPRLAWTAWILQDASNHRGTERRGYGVGGNAKGPAAQPRQPNKGHIGYGSGENEIELDALYRALRGERERELQRMRATSHDRLTAETGEEREARLQQMRDCCYVCS